jgi:hypothetical protein
MNWESFYLICFGAGLLLSVLSFAGGFGHLHLGHLHFGHHAHTGQPHTNGISPFNLFTAMGAALIFGFLTKVLLPRERTMLPEDTEMCGVVATVSSELRPSGLGEILFSLDGTRRGAAARSENGQPIPRNTQVLVMRYEQGVAYVRPFNDLDDLEAPKSSDLTPT